MEILETANEIIWWQAFLYLLIAFITEIFIGIFFNFKIKYIANGKYKKAALNGATATFLYFCITGTMTIIAVIYTTFWFIIVTAFVLSIASFLATIIVKKLQNKQMKSDEKENNDNIDKNISNKNEQNNEINVNNKNNNFPLLKKKFCNKFNKRNIFCYNLFIVIVNMLEGFSLWVVFYNEKNYEKK